MHSGFKEAWVSNLEKSGCRKQTMRIKSLDKSARRDQKITCNGINNFTSNGADIMFDRSSFPMYSTRHVNLATPSFYSLQSGTKLLAHNRFLTKSPISSRHTRAFDGFASITTARPRFIIQLAEVVVHAFPHPRRQTANDRSRSITRKRHKRGRQSHARLRSLGAMIQHEHEGPRLSSTSQSCYSWTASCYNS